MIDHCNGRSFFFISCFHTSSPFRFVIYPLVLSLKEDQRQHAHYENHEPCHGTSVSQLIIGKGVKIHIHRIEQCAVSWLSLRDDVALGKCHKAVNQLVNQVEKDGGCQHWKCNLKEPLNAIGSIYGSRLIETDRNLF